MCAFNNKDHDGSFTEKDFCGDCQETCSQRKYKILSPLIKKSFTNTEEEFFLPTRRVGIASLLRGMVWNESSK